MQDFTKSIKFIVSFLILTLLLSTFTNQKVTFSFLTLVLFSMAILNAEKIKTMLGGVQQ